MGNRSSKNGGSPFTRNLFRQRDSTCSPLEQDLLLELDLLGCCSALCGHYKSQLYCFAIDNNQEKQFVSRVETMSTCALTDAKLCFPMPLACCEHLPEQSAEQSFAAYNPNEFKRWRFTCHTCPNVPRMIRTYNQHFAPKAPTARVCRASARRFIVGVPDTRRSRRPLKRHPTCFAALQTSNMGALHNDIEKVLYTEEAIAQAVNKLGK